MESREAATVAVAENWERIQERVQAALKRAGRGDNVTVVAVTKTVPVERIAEAYRCGVRHFGESRVQEFEDKRGFLALPEATFHLVGHLQRNKARRAAELFDRVDSLDSLPLAEALARAAAGRGGPLPVLLEVNLGGEATKHGVAPEQVSRLAQQAARLGSLRVEGLMAVPPYFDDPEAARPFFRRLRALAAELERERIPGVSLRELSMGMSHDFEVAIEEGATQVRIGTALFGPRPAGR